MTTWVAALLVALIATLVCIIASGPERNSIRECVFFGCAGATADEFEAARAVVFEADRRLTDLDVHGAVELARRRVISNDNASAVIEMLLERQHEKLCKRCRVLQASKLLRHVDSAFPVLAERAAFQLRKAEAARLLGHEADAQVAVDAAATLAASEGSTALPLLANAHLMMGDYAEAFRLYRKAHALTRSTGGAGTDIVSTFKLQHDLEQLEHLGLSGPQPAYRAALAALAAMPLATASGSAGRLADPAGRPVLALGNLRPEGVRDQLRAVFNVPHHLPRSNDVWEGNKRALNRAHDFGAYEAAFIAGEVVIIDDFLTPEALAALQTLSTEATVFNAAMPGGYVGAMHRDGWAPAVLAAVAQELEAALPRVLGGHWLRKWWAFKHDSVHAPDGIFAHADEAAVNVNFWVTPDEANLGRDAGGNHDDDDPGPAAPGGLIVYANHPNDADFEAGRGQSYISSADQRVRRQEALGTGQIQRIVPYKANRAVIFSSRKWHATDRHRFAGGLGKHRVNLTLLFGLLAAVQCSREGGGDAIE